MKTLRNALSGLVIALALASCKDDETPQPSSIEQFKVEVVNEGEIRNFTQRLSIGVSGTAVLDAEVSGAAWDDVSPYEGDESRTTTRHFSKDSDVPGNATYKTVNDLNYLRYLARIQPKEGTESTMQTKIIFYRAGERIGEKNYTITGKGGEFVIDYHDGYDFFSSDNYQPL